MMDREHRRTAEPIRNSNQMVRNSSSNEVVVEAARAS